MSAARRSRVTTLVLFAAGLGTVELGSTRALAAADDVKKACIDAADEGQRLRSDGKLKAARQEFLRCSRAECPALVRHDCEQWLTEVTSSLPSVVVGARDPQGRDVVEVRVSVDGSVVAERLDGKSIAIDPGVHQFRYERADGVVVEERVVVRLGEQNRALTVAFPGPPGSDAKASRPAPAPTARDRPEAEPAGAPAAAWVLGGVGLAALGAALYLDLSANAEVTNLRETCAPSCAESDVDAVRTRYTMAAAFAGAGAVALGISIYLFVDEPESPAQSGALRLDLSPIQRGAAAGISGTF